MFLVFAGIVGEWISRQRGYHVGFSGRVIIIIIIRVNFRVNFENGGKENPEKENK